MLSYYWFVIFAILAYFIITDKSFAQYFLFLVDRFKFNYEKIKWWLLNNPQNPIVKYLMYRRSLKLAKELLLELGMEDKIDK
jgi:hypothetical protein